MQARSREMVVTFTYADKVSQGHTKGCVVLLTEPEQKWIRWIKGPSHLLYSELFLFNYPVSYKEQCTDYLQLCLLISPAMPGGLSASPLNSVRFCCDSRTHAHWWLTGTPCPPCLSASDVPVFKGLLRPSLLYGLLLSHISYFPGAFSNTMFWNYLCLCVLFLLQNRIGLKKPQPDNLCLVVLQSICIQYRCWYACIYILRAVYYFSLFFIISSFPSSFFCQLSFYDLILFLLWTS